MEVDDAINQGWDEWTEQHGREPDTFQEQLEAAKIAEDIMDGG